VAVVALMRAALRTLTAIIPAPGLN
jgi:hypothetical protein